MKHNEKDQGEAIAKAIRALFMKSDFQTIINSDQMFKKGNFTAPVQNKPNTIADSKENNTGHPGPGKSRSTRSPVGSPFRAEDETKTRALARNVHQAEEKLE